VQTRFLSPEAIARASMLARVACLPQKIIALRKQIEAEVRAAELNFSVTKNYDEGWTKKIAGMKARLENLIVEFVEEKKLLN